MQNKNGFQANFGGDIIFGIPGKDGGYYLVNAEQINTNTLRLTFTPSQDGMALVDPVNINLPGATDEQIQKIVLEYLKDNPAIGKPGEDGFSPIAKVAQTEEGAVVTITDKNGTTEAIITNGKDGEPGKDGEDGYTPIKGKDYFDGKDGVTPEFTIGTVETLDPGSDAAASISGTKENPVLNLGIPQGMPGKGGEGGGAAFPELVDNIVIEQEGVTTIELAIDLTICKEARFYISVPANNTGQTKNYYVRTANVLVAANLGWVVSYPNVATGTTVFYKGLSETLGDFSFSSGMQGADISRPNIAGGTGDLTTVKSPRNVSKDTELVWADADTFFPVGTRVQTYMWR